MTYSAREPSPVDAPTQRFGAYMAVVFAVQFLFGLLGVGREDGGYSIQVLHPLLFAAALAVRAGYQWGRSVLVGFTLVFMVLVALLALFSGSPAAILIVLPIEGFLFLHLAASAFTLATAPPALGLPERWRPWATSRWLHVLLLVLGLLGALGGGYDPPDDRA